MKKIIDKTENVVAENVVDAKSLKEKLNQKTNGMVKKSDDLTKKSERKTDRMLVRAKGRAQKVINKA
jgi:F0F1-type ATP synthase membrane subunit b/b'